MVDTLLLDASLYAATAYWTLVVTASLALATRLAGCRHAVAAGGFCGEASHYGNRRVLQRACEAIRMVMGDETMWRGGEGEDIESGCE